MSKMKGGIKSSSPSGKYPPQASTKGGKAGNFMKGGKKGK